MCVQVRCTSCASYLYRQMYTPLLKWKVFYLIQIKPLFMGSESEHLSIDRAFSQRHSSGFKTSHPEVPERDVNCIRVKLHSILLGLLCEDVSSYVSFLKHIREFSIGRGFLITNLSDLFIILYSVDQGMKRLQKPPFVFFFLNRPRKIGNIFIILEEFVPLDTA